MNSKKLARFRGLQPAIGGLITRKLAHTQKAERAYKYQPTVSDVFMQNGFDPSKYKTRKLKVR